MTTNVFPDAETVRTALALATRAPSVHNTQPWRWRVGATSLHLRAEPSLQLRHTDPDSRDLLISCGAVLHHCAVALEALGWHSRIQRFPDPTDPWHLASIEVEPAQASQADVALAAAIPRRRTDRRVYGPWPVAPGDVALMGSRAARMGVTMRRVQPAAGLKTILARAIREHVDDVDYLTELTVWSGRHASTAGVPAGSTPEPPPTASVPGRFFAGPSLAQPPNADVADDNGILLALGTAEDDAPARLRAGEATSLLLLTATALGMATCPVTEVLEVGATRDAVRTEVFGVDAFPQMLIRVGWAAANADPLPSTPRRALSDVVETLDGSPFG
jgi:nitroreductase